VEAPNSVFYHYSINRITNYFDWVVIIILLSLKDFSFAILIYLSLISLISSLNHQISLIFTSIAIIDMEVRIIIVIV